MKRISFLLLSAVLLVGLLMPRIHYAQDIVDEVFLLERQDKLLAFSGLRNTWVEKDLRTGETVIKSSYDGNVAVAYTTERALAFSSITARWSEKRFRIRESVTSMSAKGDVATIITDIRALGFSAKTGNWVESEFKLND